MLFLFFVFFGFLWWTLYGFLLPNGNIVKMMAKFVFKTINGYSPLHSVAQVAPSELPVP